MKALAIRHVLAEHLGMMERSLRNLGFKVEYLDTAEGETLKEPLEEYSFLVVLGGYMGAYEESIYPFLSYEFRLMEQALKLNIPILGICLGAQILAKVLGARVFKGDKGKEIGWMDVFKVGEHELFQEFPNVLKVFQWHGDTFELPKGALRVYASEKYENQAFVYGKAVGLQFHIEVDQSMVKEWAELYRDELQEEKVGEDMLRVEDWVYEQNYRLIESLIRGLI
jgi:GMP synthase-like glutamine amidotransferase